MFMPFMTFFKVINTNNPFFFFFFKDIRDVSHQPPNGDIDGEGSEDKNDDNGRDRPGLSSLPCDPDGEAHLPDTPGTPGTPATEEEWEEVEARASNSGYVHISFFFAKTIFTLYVWCSVNMDL